MRLISAALPKKKDEIKEAEPKKALMRPTSKYEAPREVAKTGINIPDITREAFERN
jgi:chromatin segregation and condensation protein Rec8/ScpA/Scc1 (kleisin family)